MVDELEARTAELREARDERARLEVATDRARLSARARRAAPAPPGRAGAAGDDGARTGRRRRPRPRRSRTSRARAGARWRRCARWSACLRDDASRARRSRSRRSPTSRRCSCAPRAPDARLTVEGNPRVLPAGSRAVGVPHRRAPARRARGRARRRACACASATTRSSSPCPGPARRRAQGRDRARARAGRAARGTLEATDARRPRRGRGLAATARGSLRWRPRRSDLLVGLARRRSAPARVAVVGPRRRRRRGRRRPRRRARRRPPPPARGVGRGGGRAAAHGAGDVRRPSFGLALLVAAHAFCAGRRESGWGGLAALLALVGALELDVRARGRLAAVPVLLITAAGWGAGRALRERELVAAQLAERARELEEEREAHAALSVRYERARIASELHDIVAHAISVMVVQASAGQRLAPHDPEATAETFEAIAGAARQAEHGHGAAGGAARRRGARSARRPTSRWSRSSSRAPRAAGSTSRCGWRASARGCPRRSCADRLPRRPGGADQRAALRVGRRRLACSCAASREALVVEVDERSSQPRGRPRRRRHRQRPAGPARARRRLRRDARGRAHGRRRLAPQRPPSAAGHRPPRAECVSLVGVKTRAVLHPPE